MKTAAVKTIIALGLAGLLLTTTGCASTSGLTRQSKERSVQNDVYAYSGTLRANTTLRGVVVQSRPVRIVPTGTSAVQLFGATIGGVGGYAATGKDEVGAVVGALVGGVLGNMFHKSEPIPGQEIVVRVVEGGGYHSRNKLITIVQGAHEVLPPSSEVFIVTGAGRSPRDVRVIPFYDNPNLRLRHRNLDSEEVDQQGKPYALAANGKRN
jgi:outer membrane lipoprotein SlyB